MHCSATEAWKNLNGSILSNAWNKLLKGTDVKVDSTGFNTKDFIETIHSSGGPDVTEEDITDWLESDCLDQGYHYHSEAEAAGENPAAADGEDMEEPSDKEDEVTTQKLS